MDFRADMSMLPTPEQVLMTDTVRDFFAEHLPVSRFRFVPGQTPTPAPWLAMSELGLFAMAMPESVGGLGLGAMDEILVLRECGRCVAPPSVFASIVASHLLGEKADDIVRGACRAALAIEDGGDVLVFDHAEANLILMGNGASVMLFPASALTSPQAVRGLDDTMQLVRGRLTSNSVMSGQVEGRAALLLAAMMVGLAEASRDLAVEYAKIRRQFGKPIGSFQAIKHRCTDMAMHAELAWAQVLQAAGALDRGRDDAAMQIASARLLATRAAHANAAASIQIHGGIGYQAECDAHVFMKRAHVYSRVMGGVEEARAAILGRAA